MFDSFKPPLINLRKSYFLASSFVPSTFSLATYHYADLRFDFGICISKIPTLLRFLGNVPLRWLKIWIWDLYFQKVTIKVTIPPLTTTYYMGKLWLFLQHKTFPFQNSNSLAFLGTFYFILFFIDSSWLYNLHFYSMIFRLEREQTVEHVIWSAKTLSQLCYLCKIIDT